MDIKPLTQDIARADGLLPGDASIVAELVELWAAKRDRNGLRDKYYLGHVPIKDLGIAIPPEVAQKLRTRVDWPRKAVTSLARSKTPSPAWWTPTTCARSTGGSSSASSSTAAGSGR